MPKPSLPHLVLLPGLDGSGVFFVDLIKSLRDKATVEVLSYPAEGAQSYDFLAANLLPKLPEDTDYVLLAESFGGPLAVMLAAQAPRKPKGLILAASFARNPFPLIGGLIVPALPGLLNARLSPVVEVVLLKPGDHVLAAEVLQAVSKLNPKTLSARVSTVLKCDVRKLLAALDLPVLYLQGAQDKLISPAHGLLMQKTAKDLRIARLPTPHFVLQYETETTVRDHLLPFLKASG